MERKYDDFMNHQKKRLRPVHGILLFVLVMVSYYTIIAWMQMKFGMYGLAMTEMYLLLLSVGITALCGADFAEVFPVRKPSWSKIFGTLLLWAGVYALVLPVTMVIAWLFPEQMFGTSSALNDIIASVPLLISIFITAVMPAVCEEAMHRGVILHSLKSLKREWLIVLIMGLLFGLFHGSVWRFMPTALLGGALSWLMLRTENMVYPALFHFANNFLPTLLSFGQTESDTAASAEYLMEFGIPVAALGIYVAIGCAAPFAIYTAGYLLRREKGRKVPYFPKEHQTFWIVFLTVSSVIPAMIGGVLFLYGIFFDDSLWQMIRQSPVENFTVFLRLL